MTRRHPAVPRRRRVVLRLPGRAGVVVGFLLRAATATLALLSVLLPFWMMHRRVPPPETISTFVPPCPTAAPSVVAAAAASRPCPCQFGPCLTWNVSSSSACAMLYPMRWQETRWDAFTETLYQRHRRTMHFEVINLRQRTGSTASDEQGEENATTNHNNRSAYDCDDAHGYPRLVTYFHIFKNGGTTMRDAMRRFGKMVRMPYRATAAPIDILFTGIQRKIGTERFHQLLNETVQEIWKGQGQAASATTIPHVAPFTFLREPISRFLSGLGQVMNKHKTGKLPDDFALAGCFANSNTSQMLDCTLQKMLAMLDNTASALSPDTEGGVSNQFMDFHLLPQAFLLRDFTGEQDIGIMVMDMENIQPILELLLPVRQRRNFWARPSRGADYTGGHDLSRMDDVLTLGQRIEICKLYRMDVELMMTTNVVHENPCVKLLQL